MHIDRYMSSCVRLRYHLTGDWFAVWLHFMALCLRCCQIQQTVQYTTCVFLVGNQHCYIMNNIPVMLVRCCLGKGPALCYIIQIHRMCGTLGSRSQGSRPVSLCQSCWHCPLTPWLLQPVMTILMSWYETHMATSVNSSGVGCTLSPTHETMRPWHHDICSNDLVLSVTYTIL